MCGKLILVFTTRHRDNNRSKAEKFANNTIVRDYYAVGNRM